jgi:hypothetical protein
VSTVVATAVAAAGIGAIGASTDATPWAAAIDNLAAGGHSQPVSSADRATASVFDWVLGMYGTQATPASRTTGGPRLDAHELLTPGLRSASHGVGIIGISTAPTMQSAAATLSARQSHPAPAAPAPSKPAPAHAAPAPAKPAPAKPAPAKPAPHPQGHPVTKPYLIYDSVAPSAIPSHQNVATYADGSYAASASSLSARGHVLWIDTNGSDTRADALDVEPGDETPSGAAQWVAAKLNADPNAVAIVYTMISDWQAVKDNVAGLPHWMQDKVRYWIADPTGSPHVLPGSNATQWYWGNSYDITTANPGFWS